MRARIHRGSHEIGGNCVELEVQGKRLVLDLGRPLDVDPAQEVDLPDIPGLGAPGDGSLLGVVLSHPHQDHYGLVAQADPSTPIYIGEAAAALLEAAAFFSPSGIELRPEGFLEDRRQFALGPFMITPYLVDHSGFDSYALLVEGDRRRLFYSGDFRAHGRKASLVRKICERPPENVDVLMLEGTHVRGDDRAVDGLDELGVERAMAEIFNSTRGMVVIFTSTQNVDRLITIYKACNAAKRTLVVDLYAATTAVATGRPSIPQPGFRDLRVYVPNRQRVLVKKSAEFERVESVQRHRIFPDEIRERAGDLAMVIQGSTLGELARAGSLDGATAIWSLWPGYLDRPSGQRTMRLLDEYSVPLVRLHSSGHASVEDLKALARAFGSARVAPIHTSAPDQFERHFDCVELHTDGEWWSV